MDTQGIKSITGKEKVILGYRFFFALLGWFSLLLVYLLQIQFLISNPLPNSNFTLILIFEAFFRLYRTFSMQTNLFVVLWLSVALFWRMDKTKLNKIMGKVKGALTLYITVTFIIYAVILSPLHQPTGLGVFTNLMIHYIMPLAFIGDWIITESNNYEWNFIPIWFVYPISYLCFAVIHGFTVGSFIYPFLNFDELGLLAFSMNVIMLVIFFTLLSTCYIFISKKILPISKFFNGNEYS